MPNLFLKPCQYAGCRKYAVKGSAYCREHQTKVSNEFDKHRGSSRERGYTSKWEKFRKTFLAEHPLCVECLKHGRIKPATDVDHIVPHKGDMNKFWNLKNLQALCHECHSRKTAIEDSNFLKTSRGS